MSLPFSVGEFFDVFRQYNLAVWPAQWVLTALGVVAVVGALVPRAGLAHAALGALAVLWLWMGAVYHLVYFAAVNPVAPVFGVLFVVQAALLAVVAHDTTAETFAPRRGAAAVVGWVLVVYALVAYPLVGQALGHRYPAQPTFGLPCPTTILTLGVLAWGIPRLPARLLVIPALWAVVATSAALQLGVGEDLGLPVAAAALAWLALRATGGVRRAWSSRGPAFVRGLLHH
ncbi:MAG TPA: DUF6064 family protein [Gemmatimonadaceae bacterium]|nr:DUF6064 family protein [Gemmatimonadaceae bacterium]